MRRKPKFDETRVTLCGFMVPSMATQVTGTQFEVVGTPPTYN